LLRYLIAGINGDIAIVDQRMDEARSILGVRRALCPP
jgi:hypothetical protein